MKTIIIFCSLFISASCLSQNLVFTDPDLKAAIINQPDGVNLYFGFPQENLPLVNIDTDSDGEISLTEAAVLGKIELNGTTLNIENLTGIEGFLNLTSIKLTNFTLANLNLSNLESLERIWLDSNTVGAFVLDSLPSLTSFTNYSGEFGSILVQNLTSLDNFDILNYASTPVDNFSVINCSVTEIHYHNAPIINVNIQDCPVLELIDVDAAGVTVFHVENCPNVTLFNLNQMNAVAPDPVSPLNLDLSGFTNLQSFGCNGWNLGNVNATNLPMLTAIGLSNCKLTSVDFTGSSAVTFVNLLGNSLLEEVDVSGMPGLTNLNLTYNPGLKRVFMKNGSVADNFSTTNGADFSALEFVCVDQGQLDIMQAALTGSGYTNVAVNSYCSFVPGGNYNTITGAVQYDLGSDGCDETDPAMSFLRVDLSGNEQGATFTNQDGQYNFYTEAGTFTLTPNFENQSIFTVSPPTATATFATDMNNSSTLDFCISPNGSAADAEIVIAPWTDAIPGFDAIYSVVIRNKGNTAVSGAFDLTYDDSVLDFILADVAPSAQNAGSLSWNFTSLLPFETRRVLVTFNLNAPIEMPALNTGDILSFASNLSSGIDINPGDNLFMFNHTVINSYDPNDIKCLEGETIDPAEIGKYLHYLVNFENLGSAAANNVVVALDVDAAMFDMSSLQVVDASANSYVRVTGNRAEFIFEDIMLYAASGNPPVGGHGNVLFKIRTNAALETGDTVMNKANIYFDYNFPIETNNAESVFQMLSNGAFAADESIGIFPNPSYGLVLVKSSSAIKSIELYDIQGRLLQTNIENRNSTTLDISGRTNGVYFIKVITKAGVSVEKLIKK